jgi:hypothetical protein
MVFHYLYRIWNLVVMELVAETVFTKVTTSVCPFDSATPHDPATSSGAASSTTFCGRVDAAESAGTEQAINRLAKSAVASSTNFRFGLIIWLNGVGP